MSRGLKYAEVNLTIDLGQVGFSFPSFWAISEMRLYSSGQKLETARLEIERVPKYNPTRGGDTCGSHLGAIPPSLDIFL